MTYSIRSCVNSVLGLCGPVILIVAILIAGSMCRRHLLLCEELEMSSSIEIRMVLDRDRFDAECQHISFMKSTCPTIKLSCHDLMEETPPHLIR
jgi:hypothetical protein